MVTVVTGNCERCRYTDCVTVCPVEGFRGDSHMLYIDPDVCISCSACIPECPVQAIVEEDYLPQDKRKWITINAERARNLPIINEKQDPLPTAEERKRALGF